MPLIENDVVFAFLNEYDQNHPIAERIFKKLQDSQITLDMSSVSLIEMELIYRSEKRENNLLRDLSALSALPNVKYIPLTPDLTIASAYLRQSLNLTFFDSHYAATALSLDRQVISFDREYEKVPGLTRVNPDNV